MSDKWEHEEALADMNHDYRVLEVGCGAGAFIERLGRHGMTATGLEFNRAAIEIARSKGLNVVSRRLKEMAEEMPCSFDAVCSFQVLEHVADPFEFLATSIELVKKGGKLIVGVPNAESFLKSQYNLLDMPPHHVSRWTSACLIGLTRYLPISLDRLITEPLAQYHVEGYIQTWVHRTRGMPAGSVLRRLKIFSMIRRLLKFSTVRRFCLGHTVYACYTVK